MDFQLTEGTTFFQLKQERMRQGYISFVQPCYFYFMVIKPFLHAQALTEHAERQFSKWVKVLGEKIFLSRMLPPEREKTIRCRQHYTACYVFMDTENGQYDWAWEKCLPIFLFIYFLYSTGHFKAV